MCVDLKLALSVIVSPWVTLHVIRSSLASVSRVYFTSLVTTIQMITFQQLTGSALPQLKWYKSIVIFNIHLTRFIVISSPGLNWNDGLVHENVNYFYPTKNFLWVDSQVKYLLSKLSARAHSPTFPSLHLRHSLFSNPSVEVKVSPLQAMKAHGDVDARVHIYTATPLGRGRVASPMLGHLYPWRKPQYSFYIRLSEFQDQLDTEEWRRNLHHSDTQDWTWAANFSWFTC